MREAVGPEAPLPSPAAAVDRFGKRDGWKEGRWDEEEREERNQLGLVRFLYT